MGRLVSPSAFFGLNDYLTSSWQVLERICRLPWKVFAVFGDYNARISCVSQIFFPQSLCNEFQMTNRRLKIWISKSSAFKFSSLDLMRIFTNVLLQLKFERGSFISSLLWEIKYWFCFLPRLARIFWTWFFRKPAREFFHRSFNRHNKVLGYWSVYMDFQRWGHRCQMWKPMRTGLRGLHINLLRHELPHWMWTKSNWLR